MKAGQLPAAQAVVEFAIVVPVLLLLLVGLINLGVLVTSQIVLTQAAWEGARAGATIIDPERGDEEIIGAVRRALSGLDESRVRVDIDPEQDEYPRNQPYPFPRGRSITVSLEYPLSLYLPFPLSLTLRTQAVSRIEYQNPP